MMRTDSAGKIAYAPVLKFASRKASDHFQGIVLSAFDKRQVPA